jgi:hypothetical protein
VIWTWRQQRWPWCPLGQYRASTCLMAAPSGFAWNHRYAPLGDVPHAVSSRRHGHRNRRRVCYIILHRSNYTVILTINTKPSLSPFQRGYSPQIGRIHISHVVGGANGTTMVVMFVDCCVGCGQYFWDYSYSRNPTGWELFDPARTLISLSIFLKVLSEIVPQLEASTLMLFN